MELFISILRSVGLLVGSVMVAVNLEIFLLRISGRLGLRRFYDSSKSQTPTEFIVFFIIIASILISFRLTGLVYGYFGAGGRVWALAAYLLLDLNNSVLNVLGMAKDAFAKRFAIYSDEMYPVFAARLVGFIAAFILLMLGLV
jgi:hypothetical protein